MTHEISKETKPSVGIRYLGQSGFLLKRYGLTIVIDPYLSDSVAAADSIWKRNYPPPVDPATLSEVDLVLCTHEHSDHTDGETLRGILSASPKCRFAGPRASTVEMIRAGLPKSQITVLNEGANFNLSDLVVEPVASAHEDYEVDDEGFQRFLGYILHWGSLSLYHSGDTLVTSRLEKALGKQPIDVGFLPINGRSEERHKLNIVGNMNSAEAVHLSAGLAKNRGFNLLVPVHYDLFTINGTDLGQFVNIWDKTTGPKPGFKAFYPGEWMIYQKP